LPEIPDPQAKYNQQQLQWQPQRHYEIIKQSIFYLVGAGKNASWVKWQHVLSAC